MKHDADEVVSRINTKALNLVRDMPHFNRDKLTVFIGERCLDAVRSHPTLCHAYRRSVKVPDREEILGIVLYRLKDPDALIVTYEG